MRRITKLIPVIGLLLLLTLPAQANFTTWVVAPFTTGAGVAAVPVVTANQITTTIPSCQSKLILGDPAINGTPLANVLNLSYDYTVTVAGASASFIYINLYIDTTGDGANDTRIDFAPGGNTTGIRSHNPLTEARWSGGGLPANSTWATVLSTFPTASIAATTFGIPGYPSLIFNIGDTGCSYQNWSGSFGFPDVEYIGQPGTAGGDCGQPANRGMLRITQSTVGYQSPGGDIIRLANGAPLEVFNDAGRDGFDEYIISRETLIDDVSWYGLFLGSCDPVWVPATAGTRIR